MSLYGLVRPAIFTRTRKDPEVAHEKMLRLLQWVAQRDYAMRILEQVYRVNGLDEAVEHLGIKFPNRIGVSAGLDKNGEIVRQFAAMGWGFEEVGTVLPRPQAGRDRPRLFRLEEYEALINRMGFNSSGARRVRINLESANLPSLAMRVGISIGMMKETPLERAHEDYCAVLRILAMYGDYLVVNVSSPNTPELRRLLTLTYIRDLVRRVVMAERGAAGIYRRLPPRPVLVKLSPDSSQEEIGATVEASLEGGARGFIASNTTTNKSSVEKHLHGQEVGGLSGDPLFYNNLVLIKTVRRYAPTALLIASGGINSGRRANAAMQSGADLIQVYTGLVYRGPGLIKELRRAVV